MQKVVTVFISSTVVLTRQGRDFVHEHEDIQSYLKDEYIIKDIHTTGVAPHYLAVTYVLEKKR